MRMPRTLYIVADGGRVRYVERVSHEYFKTFRKFISAHLHDKSSALGRDKPARVQESAAPARHSIAARVDLRDKIEREFIQSIAADLRDDRTVNSFDNLVLVAPGKLLTLLRDSLPSGIAAKVIRCIDHDLTKVPDAELGRHLPVFLVSQPTT